MRWWNDAKKNESMENEEKRKKGEERVFAFWYLIVVATIASRLLSFSLERQGNYTANIIHLFKNHLNFVVINTTFARVEVTLYYVHFCQKKNKALK